MNSRRQFLKQLGLSAATLPFVSNLSSFAETGIAGARKQRLIVMFSPNGTVPWDFWPEEEGTEFTLKRILQPLSDFQDRMLVLKGVCDKVRGDGDNHMRGMGCLLTGIESNCIREISRAVRTLRQAGPVEFLSIRRSEISCRPKKKLARGLVHWNSGSWSRTGPTRGRG